ncbi:50S ribosomal protein L28 [Pseudomonadota bacterium]
MARKCDLVGIGVMSGHNVPNSMKKTKRKFLPNLQELSLKSDALGSKVTLKIASCTLRTLNKYGSLDAFLVNYRFAKLTDKAKKLRRKVMKALEKKGELENIQVKKEKKVKKETKSKKVLKKEAKPKTEKKVEKKTESKKIQEK